LTVRRRTALKIAVPIIAVAALAACSSSSSSKSGSSASAPGSSAGTTAASTAAAKDAYNIGYIGSNNAAAAGFNQYYQGFNTYIESINKTGGVNGHKLNVIFDNDQNFDAPTELGFYTQLTQQQHALAIVGLTLDNSAPAIEAKGQSDHVPVILGVAAERAAVEPVRKYVFEFTQIFRNDVQAAGAEAGKDGITGPIALLTIDSPESRDASSWAAAEYPKLGYGVNLATTQYLPLTQTDYTSEVQAAKAAGAKALIVIQSPSGTVLVEKAMAQLGYKVPVYGESADVASFTAYAGAGIPYSVLQAVKVSGVPGLAALQTAAAASGNTALVGNGTFTAGYVGAEVLAEAVKGCGDTCTPESLDTAMESVSKFDTGGFTPPVTLSATNHLLPSAGSFITYSNGQFVSSDFVPFSAY
jgi:branched-chain amino acid transport system substrate-binding protein